MLNNFLSILLLAIIVLLIVAYNRGIKLRNYVREAFSTMDVYLKKRWDLIPNLVEVTKAYATHEKTLFEEVAMLRSNNYDQMSENEKLETNTEISSALSKIMAVVENYPEIKANQHFVKLMENLTQIEDEIANSRRYYNGCVRILNNYAEIFPTNIIAKISGIKEAKMFEASLDAQKEIKVDL